MKTPIRTLAVTAVAATAALSMSVGPAFAFHCYNTSRSDQGNTSASQGAALLTVTDFAAFCGVTDPDDVETIIEGLEAQDFPTDVLINGHAVMAGGLQKSEKGHELLGNEKGIDHLEEDFIIAFDALVLTVGGDCSGL